MELSDKEKAAAELAQLTRGMSADAQNLWSRMVLKAMRRGVQIDVIEGEVAAARELCELGLVERAGGILVDEGGHISMTTKFANLMERASA